MFVFVTFAGKWAWPQRPLLMIWGLQTRPKSWPTGRTFWANHYLEIMFRNFKGWNAPPPWSLSKVSQLIIIIGNYMRNIGYCAEQFSLLTHANVIQNFPLSRPPMETYWSKLLYHNYYLSLLTSLVDLNRLLKIRIISNVNNKARHV